MDYFEAVDSDWEASAMAMVVALEERRQRRRRTIGLAVLCVSFVAVVAVSWWLK